MFERYTDRARRVVMLASEHARTLGHGYIGGDHLLLGMLGEGEAIAAQALSAVGVTYDDMRARVVKLFGETSTPLAVHIPFTPDAKRALELGFREALQLGHNFIAPEHLLLGLIAGEGTGRQLLEGAGVDLGVLHGEVFRLLKGDIDAVNASREAGRLAARTELVEKVADAVAAVVRLSAPPDLYEDVIEALRRRFTDSAGPPDAAD